MKADGKGKKRRLPAITGKGPFVRKEPFMRWMIEFARQAGMTVEILGAAEASETEDGVRFRINPGGELADHAWKCKSVDGVYTMMGGSYNSIALDPTELYDGDGIAYIKATWTLSVVGGYVESRELASVVVEVGVSVPANEPDAAIFYVPLVTFSSRKVLAQHATRSISAACCDDGSGDGKDTHTIIQS